MLKYPVEIFWSDEDHGYIAIAPDLPGCSAWGASPEDALREVQSAADAWLEATRSMGRPAPEPSHERWYRAAVGAT